MSVSILAPGYLVSGMMMIGEKIKHAHVHDNKTAYSIIEGKENLHQFCYEEQGKPHQ